MRANHSAANNALLIRAIQISASSWVTTKSGDYYGKPARTSHALGHGVRIERHQFLRRIGDRGLPRIARPVLQAHQIISAICAPRRTSRCPSTRRAAMRIATPAISRLVALHHPVYVGHHKFSPVIYLLHRNIIYQDRQADSVPSTFYQRCGDPGLYTMARNKLLRQAAWPNGAAFGSYRHRRLDRRMRLIADDFKIFMAVVGERLRAGGGSSGAAAPAVRGSSCRRACSR